MNKIFYFLTIAALSMLAACSSEDLSSEIQLPHELRFKMDVEKPSFDGSSRANGAGWEQGDSLFLRFTKTGGYACSVAVYDDSTDDWVIKDVPSLDLEETKKLELVFFNGSKSMSGETVALSPTTAVYTDDGTGTYQLTMANGFVPVIKGHLVPCTARLRFKGEAGTTFAVSGLRHNSAFNTSSMAATTSTDAVVLTIGADGYTPYIYCTFAGDSRVLNVIQEIAVGTNEYRYTFSASGSTTMLQKGKSGWRNLPTYSSHAGWEMRAETLTAIPSTTAIEMSCSAGSETVGIEANITWTASSSASWLTCTKKSDTELTLTAPVNTSDTERTATVSIKDEKGAVKASINVKQQNRFNGYEYVDLGLPSGLLWATCNVDASKPEDCGGYYAWGETKEKNNYTWDTYLKDFGGTMFSWVGCGTTNDPLRGYVYPNNKSIGATQYDVARQSWGGTWHQPTRDDMKELVTQCTTTRTTQGGVPGCKVTGPNGNSIFLPAAGFKKEGTLDNGPTSSAPICYYWTSSSDASTASDAFYLGFDAGYFISAHDRYIGQSVRPVSE